MIRLDDLTGLGGWDSSSHPVLHDLVDELRPKRIIEVGVWKGASLWWMAKKVNELALDTEIVAVDTWLGSPEFESNPEMAADVGRSYDIFLANMFSTQAFRYVTVLRQTSCNAAVILLRKEMKAELIHIDAGHQEWQVFRDLEDYAPLLTPSGAIVGDDYDWPSVRAGAEKFTQAYQGWSLEDHGSKLVLRRV